MPSIPAERGRLHHRPLHRPGGVWFDRKTGRLRGSFGNPTPRLCGLLSKEILSKSDVSFLYLARLGGSCRGRKETLQAVLTSISVRFAFPRPLLARGGPPQTRPSLDGDEDGGVRGGPLLSGAAPSAGFLCFFDGAVQALQQPGGFPSGGRQVSEPARL